MNLNQIISLEHTTLFKVAILLWNTPDIRLLIQEFVHSRPFINARGPFFTGLHMEKRNKWKTIEKNITENAAKLRIPATLKDKMIGYIHSVGVEVLKWLEYHLNLNFLSDLELPHELSWTLQGTIDKKKTVEILIKDDNINSNIRFKLASIYCLENDIPKLWDKIPECEKKLFSCENDLRRQNEFATFFAYKLKNEIAKMDEFIISRLNRYCSPYLYLFTAAANSGNVSATEYFFKKLNPSKDIMLSTTLSVLEHRNSLYRRTETPEEYTFEVACFLLSKMDDNQQLEVFKTNPYKALAFITKLPWKISYIKIVNHLWDFLSDSDYCMIFLEIAKKICHGYEDYNYKKIIL